MPALLILLSMLQALHFLGAMAMARLAPDVISFNGVISSSAKSSHWRHALRLFQAMAPSSLQPDATGTAIPCPCGHATNAGPKRP